MTELNGKIAAEIADLLKANGYDCTPEDVFEVARHGSVREGVIGPDYDDALTDQITDQLDARGVKLP